MKHAVVSLVLFLLLGLLGCEDQAPPIAPASSASRLMKESLGSTNRDYELIDLGANQGGAYIASEAFGINRLGVVVGFRNGWVEEAFMWEEGHLATLPPLEGEHARAQGINDRNQIVGASVTADGYYHAVLWENGTITDLGTLGGTISAARAINNVGQIVGNARTAEDVYHAALWEKGKVIDLGTLGGARSIAYGINDRGQVVGEAQTSQGFYHAFLWEKGVMIDLGTLGGSVSRALAINNREEIVGYSTRAPRGGTGVLWKGGEMIALTPPEVSSSAYAINQRGQIAAISTYPALHPIIWEHGEITELAPQAGGFTITDINEVGQFVGRAYLPGPAGDALTAVMWSPLVPQ